MYSISSPFANLANLEFDVAICTLRSHAPAPEPSPSPLRGTAKGRSNQPTPPPKQCANAMDGLWPSVRRVCGRQRCARHRRLRTWPRSQISPADLITMVKLDTDWIQPPPPNRRIKYYRATLTDVVPECSLVHPAAGWTSTWTDTPTSPPARGLIVAGAHNSSQSLPADVISFKLSYAPSLHPRRSAILLPCPPLSRP